MLSVLVQNWWAFVLRGVIAIVFGLIALFLPGVTMLSLVLVFAAYAIADGVFAIAAAVRAAKANERWGWLVFEGAIDILAGIAAAAMPGITVVFFVWLLAFWAVITGAAMLAVAFKVDADHGRWWFLLAGVASLAYGVLLVIAPMIGAVVLVWWIGAYALVFGIAMVAAALSLRAKVKSLAPA